MGVKNGQTDIKKVSRGPRPHNSPNDFARVASPIVAQPLRSTGGWLELYAYICPQILHTHVGYGIDDPLDRDLAPGQPVRNDTWFANLIWDPSKYFRAALEVTYRKTAYLGVPNNQGTGIQTQFQFRF